MELSLAACPWPTLTPGINNGKLQHHRSIVKTLVYPWCISSMCHRSTGAMPTTKSLSSGSQSESQESGRKRAHTSTTIPRGKRPASLSTAMYNKKEYIDMSFPLTFEWHFFCCVSRGLHVVIKLLAGRHRSCLYPWYRLQGIGCCYQKGWGGKDPESGSGFGEQVHAGQIEISHNVM